MEVASGAVEELPKRDGYVLRPSGWGRGGVLDLFPTQIRKKEGEPTYPTSEDWRQEQRRPVTGRSAVRRGLRYKCVGLLRPEGHLLREAGSEQAERSREDQDTECCQSKRHPDSRAS